MLCFDRFVGTRSRALDLATGRHVDIARLRLPRATDERRAALFETRHGRTLIDLDVHERRRVEIWERWRPRGSPTDLQGQVASFVELLDCARAGAPRAFDLADPQHHAIAYLTRVFAREARTAGWVPITATLLAAFVHPRTARWPGWLADRSLVVFVETPGLSGDAAFALIRLAQRDVRPHVLVRTLAPGRRRAVLQGACTAPSIAHEQVLTLKTPPGRDTEGPPSLAEEAAARWALLLEDTRGGSGRRPRVIDLAQVLAARGQPFEARALVESVPAGDAARVGRGDTVLASIDRESSARAARGWQPRGIVRGWEMVDDFVGVLQMCQDVEDEQVALARVGAYLRERLQASSVAFVARAGASPRVLARAGSDTAGVDLAVRAIDTGVAIRPARPQGPVEAASPVRHAAEVIGAVWCRWSAGTVVAADQAATLMGIAAAATAPSLRLALARVRPVERATAVPELVGDSAAMATVRDAIVRAAATPFPVVIEGESGSGKELAARAIHARSPRRDRRFCAINCAALVDDLVEAELFGHVRGAFTGATTDRPGVFEDAGGGTLLLDEVVELGARVQAKLLRTLQEGEIRRLGETMVRKVDVRIVAATNRPLGKAVETGAFREDLWYRLDVVRIQLPPLRQRLEDLPALVAHLWQGLAARTGSRAALAPATVAALALYDWPGNIRELQNVLASLLVAAPPSGLVHPSVLPAHLARASACERSATLASARRQFDERFVRAALARAGGRQALAARTLGLSRQGLSKLMSRLGIADQRGGSARTANVQ